MSKIKLLSKSIAQKIAAGEVVERPSSVVKELLENSIDADATFITVEIEDGGKKLIRVSDNGTGIEPDDVELAFLRHATSKIETEEDLYNIHNMGFRGEALYSISAVSKTTMITKTVNAEYGKRIVVNGGELEENIETGCPIGTTIIVKDLFYNTPARLKFMKSSSAETSQIASIIQKIILSRPDISIKLIVNGSLIYQSNGDGSLKNAIHSIYGSEITNNIDEFYYKEYNITVSGVLGNKYIFRNSRINQTLFVNKRYVKDKQIIHIVESAYGSLLMKGKHPFFVIYIDVDSREIDVNVHPQKLYVKFSNQNDVDRAIYNAIKEYTYKIGAQPKELIKDDDNSVIVEPVRRAHSFEFINTEEKKVEETIFEETKQEDREENIFVPKHYDYKRELELKKSLIEPMKLKQKSYDVKVEQKTYLSDEDNIKIIGSAFNSYIIVEHKDSLYLIDQHAAHERLLYENFRLQNEKEQVYSQKLLIPQTIYITYEEKLIIEENIKRFESLGFMFDNYTDKSFDIIEVPHILGQPKLDGFFIELFDLLLNGDDSNENSVIDKIISMSCKKAVKAGDSLSVSEIKTLLTQIKNEDIPLTCPHGRPFVMKIDKKQIDKNVGRIQ